MIQRYRMILYIRCEFANFHWKLGFSLWMNGRELADWINSNSHFGRGPLKIPRLLNPDEQFWTKSKEHKGVAWGAAQPQLAGYSMVVKFQEIQILFRYNFRISRYAQACWLLVIVICYCFEPTFKRSKTLQIHLHKLLWHLISTQISPGMLMRDLMKS